MSRRNRSRNRQAVAKAPRPPAGGVTYSAAQVGAILMAQQQLNTGQMTAAPLPTDPAWDTSPFGPGYRLKPSPINTVRPDTQRAEPRLWEYPVGWNLQLTDIPHVPWKTLQDAANMPLFRKCIKRRKGVCSLGFTVTLDPKAVAREAAASGQADKDVEKAMRAKYMPDIIRISDWFDTPDRKNGWDWGQWTSLLMENMLKFDAACVYPRYTYGGDLFALEVIDGKTIKPLLDESGGRPLPPLPAYQQIMYAFPRGEFTASVDPADIDPRTGRPRVPGWPSDTLLYERRELRSESPYGMSDTEIALIDGLLWMRRMGWLMAEYTHGVAGAMLETPETAKWNPQQWEEWLRAINDHLSGNTADRLRWELLPPGMKAFLPPEVAERYKPDMDMFLIKLIAGDFGLTATELGFPEVGSLGASFHEGEEDVLNRVTRKPDSSWLAGIATKCALRHMAMPTVLQFQVLGLESEDEAAADTTAQNQVASGRLTLNQDRERRGEPSYDFPEADMPMLQVGRGVVFLQGASTSAPPGTLIGPAMAPPTAVAPGLDDTGQQPAGQEPGGPAAKAVRAAAGKLGQAASDAAALARSLAPDEDDGPVPGSVSAELAAYRRWYRKGGPRGTFTCKAMMRADAPPEMAGDARVAFKGDAPDPKALAGRGLAGTGTRTS